MTWTQGQPARRDQSPFLEPADKYRTYANLGQSISTSNIPNPAATFTKEGLTSYATILAGTVEASLETMFPSILDRVLDQSLLSFRTHLNSEFQKLSRDIVDALPDNCAPQQPCDSTFEDVKRPERIKGRSQDESQINKELEAVLAVLKAAGTAMKAGQLRALTKNEVVWGSNPSITLSRMVRQSRGRIVRVNKGIYQYREAGKWP